MKSEARDPESETDHLAAAGGGMARDSRWPMGGRHFVAYHNIDLMGYDFNTGDEETFAFFSRKSRALLDQSIGGAVWVITGKKDPRGKKTYRLAAVYEPSVIRKHKDAWRISGKNGCSFEDEVELNDLPWFSKLLRQQGHFGLGFNTIKSDGASDGLLKIWSEANPGAEPEKLTTGDFRTAFTKIGPEMTAKQMEMLRAHYNAPGHKLTAGQLAAAVGYPNHQSANLQYGKVGSLLCKILGQTEGSDALNVLAEFIRPGSEVNREWIWQMRDPAARALEELGWVQTKEAALPATEDETPPARISTTINRIIRDTASAKALKNLYHFRCQVCGVQIQPSSGSYYVEVHHVRPLGGEHEGLDDQSNMLVLCPNHHAMFDLWMPKFIGADRISINGDEFELEMKHELSTEVIVYYSKLCEKQL